MANSLLIISLLFVALALLGVVLIRVFKRPKPKEKMIGGAEFTNEDPSRQLLQAVKEFCQSDGWKEGRRVLENHPELLRDETDQIVESLIRNNAPQKNAEATMYYKMLLHRRNLIRRSREVGVKRAFAEHKSLVRIVRKFCSANASSVGRRLLKRHPELISDQADLILEHLIHVYSKQEDHSKVTRVVQRRALLHWAKEVGIDTALGKVKHTIAEPPLEVLNIADELATLVQTKDMPKRIELCRRALTLISREEHVEWWAWLQNELAGALGNSPTGNHIENVRAAIKALEEGLQVLKGRDPQLWADLTANVAICQAVLGESNSARHVLQTMLESTANTAPLSFKAGLLTNIARSYAYSSGSYRNSDPENVERAIEFYNKARENLTPEEDPITWININTELGRLYLDREKLDRKKRGLDQNTTLAIQACEQALSLSSPEFQPWSCFVAANMLGNIHFGLKNWRSGYEAFKTAIAAGEECYRMAYALDHVQLHAQMNEISYDQMLEMCLNLLDDPRFACEAFIYSEAGKARYFREQIGQSLFPVPSEIPSDLFVHESELLSAISQINRDLERPQISLDEGQRLIETRKKLRQQLDTFWNDLEQQYPSAQDYVAFRRARAPTWNDLQHLAEQLGKEAAIVEFYALMDRIVAFVVYQGIKSPCIFELPISYKELFSRYVHPYMNEIINRSDYTSFDAKPTHQWLELGEELLAPLESALSGKRLVYFVAHKALHIMPLHALTCNGKPFIARHAVAYVPSAAVLRRVLQRAANRDDNNEPLVMGYTPNVDEFEREIFLGEAVTVAEYFGVKPLLDHEASSLMMRQLAPRARLIHLSCHGSFTSSDPFGSYVLLSDGQFSIREWMQLRVRADLITLSACQTGFGYHQSGDEIIGASRALLYTGASTALVALWSVNALATAEWMQLFYQHLGSHKTNEWQPAFAFQQATLDLFGRNNDPYYWAPFVLMGIG